MPSEKWLFRNVSISSKCWLWLQHVWVCDCSNVKIVFFVCSLFCKSTAYIHRFDWWTRSKKNISIWQCVRHYALYVDNRKIGAIEIEMTSIWLICRSNWVQCQIFRFFFFFRFYYTPDFTKLIIYDMTISRITCENTQFAHLLGFFCSMGELIKEKWMKPIDFVEKCWFGRASSKNQTYSTDFLFLVRFFLLVCLLLLPPSCAFNQQQTSETIERKNI